MDWFDWVETAGEGTRIILTTGEETVLDVSRVLDCDDGHWIGYLAGEAGESVGIDDVDWAAMAIEGVPSTRRY